MCGGAPGAVGFTTPERPAPYADGTARCGVIDTHTAVAACHDYTGAFARAGRGAWCGRRTLDAYRRDGACTCAGREAVMVNTSKVSANERHIDRAQAGHQACRGTFLRGQCNSQVLDLARAKYPSS